MTTDSYEQCTAEEGKDVILKVAPFLKKFITSIPEGQEDLYISAMATLCIMSMLSIGGNPDAVKVFLERAIADLPHLKNIANQANLANSH